MEKADAEAHSVLVEGGRLFHVQGRRPDKLSRLCACCEQLGLHVLSAGTEPGTEGAPLFRAHLSVSGPAGKGLSEATCQHLSVLLAGSPNRTTGPPPVSQTSSQRASLAQRKPANGNMLQAASSLPSATIPQAFASWRANSDPQCCAGAQLKSASTSSTEPIAISLGSNATSSGSSTFNAEHRLTPSSSTGTDKGGKEHTPHAAGRRTSDASPSPMQISLDAAVETQPPVSPLAASISHLTEQARGISTPDRYKVAAAIWELDHSALQIHRKIGEGSYGEVLLGTYKGTRVAVKRLHDTMPVVAKLFEQEIEIMAGIRHPNVVNFYGACHSPNLCLVTEHCARGSLDHLLHKSRMPLDLVRKTEFGIDIARGMNCLHEQRPAIIHRDLKTGNLLVSTRFEIKVSDFGLSRLKYEREQQSSRPNLEGTVEYCSPEVLRGEPYSEKCDVWSYGVVLHELLTQTRPYAEMGVSVYLLMLKIGDGTLELPPVPENQATPGLCKLVQRCLSFRPQDRPSFRDVLYFLEPELRVARGRSSAVRRSVTSNCILSPQPSRGDQQCQHAAQRAVQEQGTPAARLQPGMSPTQSTELEKQHASRKLEDCQQQLRSSRSELRNSQSELQQLQQAVVKAAPFTPPARAQPPLPLTHELRSSPSADLAVYAEPVVAIKAKECASQPQQLQQQQQQQQQQQVQQQEQQQERQQDAEASSTVHTQGALRKEAMLPCITEESSQAGSSSSGSTTPSSTSLASRPASETRGPPRLNSLLGLPAPLLHSSSSMFSASSRSSSSSKLSSKSTAPTPAPAGTQSADAAGAACSSQHEHLASSGPASAPEGPLGRLSCARMSTGVGQGASSSAGSSPFAFASHASAFGDTAGGDPRPATPSASPFALASAAPDNANNAASAPAGRSSPFALASHTHTGSSGPRQSEHDTSAGWL